MFKVAFSCKTQVPYMQWVDNQPRTFWRPHHAFSITTPVFGTIQAAKVYATRYANEHNDLECLKLAIFECEEDLTKNFAAKRTMLFFKTPFAPEPNSREWKKYVAPRILQ